MVQTITSAQKNGLMGAGAPTAAWGNGGNFYLAHMDVQHYRR